MLINGTMAIATLQQIDVMMPDRMNLLMNEEANSKENDEGMRDWLAGSESHIHTIQNALNLLSSFTYVLSIIDSLCFYFYKYVHKIFVAKVHNCNNICIYLHSVSLLLFCGIFSFVECIW